MEKMRKQRKNNWFLTKHQQQNAMQSNIRDETYSLDDVSEKLSSQSLSDIDRLTPRLGGGTQVLCIACDDEE